MFDCNLNHNWRNIDAIHGDKSGISKVFGHVKCCRSIVQSDPRKQWQRNEDAVREVVSQDRDTS